MHVAANPEAGDVAFVENRCVDDLRDPRFSIPLRIRQVRIDEPLEFGRLVRTGMDLYAVRSSAREIRVHHHTGKLLE